MFPGSANITARKPFGPTDVSLEELKLENVKAIEFMLGDHRDESFPFLQQVRQAAKLINMCGWGFGSLSHEERTGRVSEGG
ncbi:hypothetical protein F4809DRAFT_634652 [Biscogniauxia mediterranea]|nr:hypothetical protein F4809DRAFT_634652 [Biscogniauxia mediterranea]